MDWNLIRNCDNEDVPDYDYRTCNHNTYMCCWTENDGTGMADNTVRPLPIFARALCSQGFTEIYDPPVLSA